MKAMDNPFVVIMYGYPATGKTYTSRALEEYCSAFNPITTLSTFTLREELGLVDLHSQSERQTIYHEMMKRADAVMEARSSNAILDGNFNLFPRRKVIYDIATKCGYQVFVVHCEVTHQSVIEERLENRKKLPKSLEHAASTMDLYYLIKDTSEPLELDLHAKAPINIIKVNSESKTVEPVYLHDSLPNHNLELVLNGIKYGFAKNRGPKAP